MEWKREFIKTVRGTFEVFTKGEGAPLCVAHHYSVFNESGDYFADTFTASHQVILINLREAGGSEKAHEPFELSMLETIFDLEAIRESFRFEKWGFAGHSTGGMLGLIYGIFFPSHLRHLILVGAAAREYATFSADCIYNPKHPQFLKMQELIEAIKNPLLDAEQRKCLTAERTALSLHIPSRYAELFNKPIVKSMSAERMDFFNRELPIYDVTRKLELIQTPAFIACGRHDVQCPLAYSLEMQAGIPASKLVIFEKSNHYPFLEEAQKFRVEVESFLQEL